RPCRLQRPVDEGELAVGEPQLVHLRVRPAKECVDPPQPPELAGRQVGVDQLSERGMRCGVCLIRSSANADARGRPVLPAGSPLLAILGPWRPSTSSPARPTLAPTGRNRRATSAERPGWGQSWAPRDWE